MPDATGYGRIIRAQDGSVSKIVEHKDATEEERQVREVNSGIYCFAAKDLFEALSHVTNDNAQGEYYLPDVLEILKKKGEKSGLWLLTIMKIRSASTRACSWPVRRKSCAAARMKSS